MVDINEVKGKNGKREGDRGKRKREKGNEEEECKKLNWKWEKKTIKNTRQIITKLSPNYQFIRVLQNANLLSNHESNISQSHKN